jgi:hypothetical protein
MATLEQKWDDLWKDFEGTRKSEWLKAKEAGKFGAMMKEVKPFKELCASLKKAEGELMDAISNRGGKTTEEAPFLLKSFVSKMDIMRKEALKKLAQASLAEMDKATKPNTYRALKVLITGIDDIRGLAEFIEETLKKNTAEIGKELSQQERIAKVQSMALLQVKKAVMKSLAEIQKVRANPTPAGWKDMISAGGTRDLCMGLVTLEGAQKKGGFANVPAAAPHKVATQPFNTAQPMAVLKDTDGNDVVATRLKAWSQLVKAVAADYQAHW